MCPQCRAFITSKDRVCPYCDAQVGPRAIDVRDPAPIAGLISSTRFVTSMILLINIVLYGAMAVMAMKHGGGMTGMDIGTLGLFGAKHGPSIIARHEYWRLVTAGFLHGGIMHILMNSWNLLDLGSQVEEIFGAPRMIVIYFAGTVLGFVASVLWKPFVISVGASAGICGLLGAMIAYSTRSKTAHASAMRGAYIRWAILILAVGLLPFPIDNAAHIGGLAGGYLVGLIAGTPKLTQGFADRFWRSAAMVCLVLTVLSFVLWFQFFNRIANAS